MKSSLRCIIALTICGKIAGCCVYNIKVSYFVIKISILLHPILHGKYLCDDPTLSR